MKKLHTDVAIIGAGTAGLNALREVEKAKCDWILIEKGSYGTMCARTGCMPSKLLIAASDVSHVIDQAPAFGIDTNEKTIDGAAVFERVRAERDRFVSFVVKSTEARSKNFRIHGAARFIGHSTLQVDNHTIVNAKSIVIASGSKPYLPPVFDTVKEEILFNDGIFELSEIPESLAVIGTGIIGIELGQAMSRLGAKVCYISRSSNIASVTDPVVLKVVRDVLNQESEFNFNSTIMSANRVPNGIRLHWIDGDHRRHQRIFDKVLVATGRISTLAELNLDAIDIQGSQLNQLWNPETTQLGDYPVFVAGDAADHRKLLHEASDEGRIAGSNAIRYPDVIAQRRRTPLSVTFCDPQIANVGSSYKELDPALIETGQASFDDQGRARVMNQHRGLIRIYADKKDCVLIGAELFAPRAEHMAHLLAWAVQQRITVQNALEMPVYHPVLEEGLRTALRNLASRLKVAGGCRNLDFAEAPGT